MQDVTPDYNTPLFFFSFKNNRVAVFLILLFGSDRILIKKADDQICSVVKISDLQRLPQMSEFSILSRVSVLFMETSKILMRVMLVQLILLSQHF